MKTKAIFDSLKVPKKDKLYQIKQIKNTNIHIVKTNKHLFGIAFPNTLAGAGLKYKNLEVQWYSKLESANKSISNILIIILRENIDVLIFSEIIDSFILNNKKKKYTERDIKKLLSKLESITAKEREDLNKVVGVWGELYFLDYLLHNKKSDNSKYGIISSWEGADTRTIVDFVLKTHKLKFEIKTTALDFRIHILHSLDQLKVNTPYKGFLVSICIDIDEEGITCNGLVKKIKSGLNDECKKLLDDKIQFRGAETLNNIYRLILNKNKTPKFYNLSDVPKPSLMEGIGHIEWEAILDNISTVSNNTISKLVYKI